MICAPRLSTFSAVAVDREAGEIGVAVQSKFIAVGAAVPWVENGAGAIATQAWANTSFGPRALAALRAGHAPDDVARELVAGDEGAVHRQFGIVDMQGRAATYTGEQCIAWAGGETGDGWAVQGNCLAGPRVVAAMAETMRTMQAPLVDRLLAALVAAHREGGDKRGQQSAALIVHKTGGGYAGFNDRYVDLRVDDHTAPIDELGRLLDLYKLYFFAPAPEDVLPIDDALGSEIAGHLARIGVRPAGAPYDAAAHDALVAFMHVENLENRVRDDNTIDRQTLDYLRTHGRS